MALTRRASVIAAALLGASAALAACTSATPAATPRASAPVASTPLVTVPAAPSATLAASSTPAASATASVPASAGASSAPSHLPITTLVPGSSLDPSLSDAGVAGRITIVDDTRPERIGTDDHTGTSEILGREADNSDCSFSLSGDDFTAVAWYDDAPSGMLHQMAVRISTDVIPANDGEQRAGISDGRVYADFSSESGFGDGLLR